MLKLCLLGVLLKLVSLRAACYLLYFSMILLTPSLLISLLPINLFKAKSVTLADAMDTINVDLNKICKRSIYYGLKINPTKTQVMVVGSSRMISKIDWTILPQVSFGSTLIPFSDKNLCIYIDSTLSWGPQLQELSCKMFAAAEFMRRLRNLFPNSTKIVLIQSLLFTSLDYVDASYLDFTENQLIKTRFKRLQNLGIRFLFILR